MDKKANKEEQTNGSICNAFLVAIDGSEGSENALNLVVKNFHRRGLDKIFLVHITDPLKDKERGIDYQSKTIYHKYSDLLKSTLNEADYEIYFEDIKQNENVFEQVNEIAVAKNATMIVLGFRGYNGTKTRPNELSKGITYLVHKPKIPVLVVKEKVLREFRQSNNFKFLVALESAESKSFKALRSMLRFVDLENDIIHGLHVETQGRALDDKHPVKIAFEQEMKKEEVKNFDFSFIEIEDKLVPIHKLVLKWVTEHLSNENHFIDFIVLGYNSSKYLFNKEAPNTTVDLIKNAHCSVYFDH